MKVSALILTYNEEGNLPRCLDALRWCDDILIVDSGSTDATKSIAEAFGARWLERPFDNFAAQRNFGLAAGDFRHDWILHLDADEVATLEFKSALLELEPPDDLLGYNIPSKTMLRGRWLRHAGMWPTYQVRLTRRGRLNFKQVGHGQREDCDAKFIGRIDEPYLHFAFSAGLAAWLTKHVRYARDEASEISRPDGGGHAVAEKDLSSATGRRRWLKALANRLPPLRRPVGRFFYVYFWRRGFLDGRAGLTYAAMLSAYEAMIASFLIWGRDISAEDARE